MREAGRGTCAGKHALLREQLAPLGVVASRLMVVGPLVPDLWPELRVASGDLLEVHECLTVETSWAGPLLVDVTWHPAAIHAGLAGTLDWDGLSDMRCAVADGAFRRKNSCEPRSPYGGVCRVHDLLVLMLDRVKAMTRLTRIDQTNCITIGLAPSICSR